MGSVGILNVGAGDTKLTFDSKNPAEVIRASRIVKDMIRRGYALLVDVEGDGRYQRALDFDEKTAEYIIADFDPVEAAAAKLVEERAEALEVDRGEEGTQEEAPTPKAKRGGQKGGKIVKRRIAATGSKAVAVGKTAGG